jgi:recombination protein RecA
MGTPFDVSKFRKTITKGIDGISEGFYDPKIWVSTKNYCLNRLISGDFYKGIPLGKVTVFGGESGSGKSFLVSGNIISEAQKQGIFVILVDTENALDEKWLHNLDVDTSSDKLLKLNMAMVNDLATLITNFVKEYKAIPEDERPKVMFVVDSLGMMLTPQQVTQFEEGNMKGHMGIKAKQLKALVTNCVNMFGSLDIGMVATNHTYESQDPFNPDPVQSGGSGFQFASSILVATKKWKLKENEDGVKGSDVLGIRCSCKIMKTRFAKPFETIDINIPYEQGMNPYSGLFDFFLDHGILIKDGSKYLYTALDGTEFKLWKKEYNKNEDGILDRLMKEYDTQRARKPALTLSEINDAIESQMQGTQEEDTPVSVSTKTNKKGAK